jgi:hypothetical protein
MGICFSDVLRRTGPRRSISNDEVAFLPHAKSMFLL